MLLLSLVVRSSFELSLRSCVLLFWVVLVIPQASALPVVLILSCCFAVLHSVMLSSSVLLDVGLPTGALAGAMTAQMMLVLLLDVLVSPM